MSKITFGKFKGKMLEILLLPENWGWVKWLMGPGNEEVRDKYPIETEFITDNNIREPDNTPPNDQGTYTIKCAGTKSKLWCQFRRYTMADELFYFYRCDDCHRIRQREIERAEQIKELVNNGLEDEIERITGCKMIPI